MSPHAEGSRQSAENDTQHDTTRLNGNGGGACQRNNTWEQDHFRRRIRNSPKALVQYIWHAVIKNDLFGHPRFQLSEQAKEAFNQFLELSRTLNLIR